MHVRVEIREDERVTRGFGHGVCSVFKNLLMVPGADPGFQARGRT